MNYQPGDVFQINEKFPKKGWVGAFIMADEIKSWGIQGFVHIVKNHDEHNAAYNRVTWEQIDYIGKAVLVTKEINEEVYDGEGRVVD